MGKKLYKFKWYFINLSIKKLYIKRYIIDLNVKIQINFQKNAIFI